MKSARQHEDSISTNALGHVSVDALERGQIRVGIDSPHMAPGQGVTAVELAGDRALEEPLPLASRERKSSSGQICETCGNTYDKSFQVVVSGMVHVFDCFECAVQKLAPTCARCACRIIGHGVEATGIYYCCAHCAQMSGVKGPQDRI